MNPKKLILLPNSKVKIVYDNGAEEVKKARPIMLKPWGIEATLQEIKTVTRRIIIPQPDHFHRDIIGKKDYNKDDYNRLIPQIGNKEIKCKQGKPGDLLYIRKNYHIRREDAEEWLLINDIQCERLQDITEEDAQREGAPWQTFNISGYDVFSWFREEWDKINANRKDKNGNILPYAWKDNPWVFPIGYSLFFQGRGVYET